MTKACFCKARSCPDLVLKHKPTGSYGKVLYGEDVHGLPVPSWPSFFQMLEPKSCVYKEKGVPRKQYFISSHYQIFFPSHTSLCVAFSIQKLRFLLQAAVSLHPSPCVACWQLSWAAPKARHIDHTELESLKTAWGKAGDLSCPSTASFSMHNEPPYTALA